MINQRSILKPVPQAFVPDGPVISSTYSLIEERAASLPDSKMIPFLLGPWKAVYQMEDGTVTKYIEHHGSKARVKIPDAQVSYQVNWNGNTIIDDVYGSLSHVTIQEDTKNEISQDAENRLKELGYIR